jgi:predicted nucleotidyltransferase
MLEKLFSSRARVEILKLFLFNPEDSFYQRQISTLTHQPIRGVQREVEKLQGLGLIEKSVQGNRVYYKTNRNCPIFEELKRILFKCTGIASALKDNLIKSDRIKFAFIYGSTAENMERLGSDIDLMIIGDVGVEELHSGIRKAEHSLGREINYSIFTEKDIVKRRKNKDDFITVVLKEKKIMLIGEENELLGTAK